MCRVGALALGASLILFACTPGPVLAQLRTRVVASGLVSPVALVQDPLDPSIQFVLERRGHVRILRDGNLEAPIFLDISGETTTDGERGLLGMAFPRDHAASRRLFLNFTNLQGHTVIARFTRSASDRLAVEPGSRVDLSWPDGRRFIEQPFSNHNGGTLRFGPDGYLYIGMGDGGSANDPQHRAQDPRTLLGKMLRIDVSVPDSDTRGYRVPADNPFLDAQPVAALGEIWAFGLRNPWKFSFDDPALGGSGAMFIGDVGQGAREEIDAEPRGAGGRNYGWRNREGTLPGVRADVPAAYTPLVEPIYDYPRSLGQSVTGGYVYRGQLLGASFRGRYFFGDFVAGRLLSVGLSVDADGEIFANDVVDHTDELGGEPRLGNIVSIDVDARGELYVVNLGGTIMRLESAPGLAVTTRGGGSVVITPPGTTCVGSCVREYPAGSVVTLEAAPGAGSRFLGWGGDPDCSDGMVTIDGGVSCIASFAQARDRERPRRDRIPNR